jgi:hypothetical protein
MRNAMFAEIMCTSLLPNAFWTWFLGKSIVLMGNPSISFTFAQA